MSCLNVTSFDIDFPQAVSLRYRLYCCCGFVEVLMIEDADAAWREFFKVFFSSARAFASTLNTRKLLDCDKRFFLIRDLLFATGCWSWRLVCIKSSYCSVNKSYDYDDHFKFNVK